VLHGMRANRWPPIRWIPDALIVLRRASDIDWDHVVTFARRHRLTHRLGFGLSVLAEKYGAPVPATVIDALRAAPTSLLERLENSVVLRDSRRLYSHPITKQWCIFADYLRVARRRDPIGFIADLPHYLRYRWRLRGRSEILPVVLRGLARRLVP